MRRALLALGPLLTLAAAACGATPEPPRPLAEGAAAVNVGLLLRDDGLEALWSGAGALAADDGDDEGSAKGALGSLPWELRDGDRVLARGAASDPRKAGGEALVHGGLVPLASRGGAARPLVLSLPNTGGTLVMQVDGHERSVALAKVPADGGATTADAAPVKLRDGGVCPLLSILVMPEGFTAAELGAFHTRADALIRGLAQVPGFAEPGRFEAYRADLASEQSGLSDAADRRTTAWNVHYGTPPAPRRAIGWTEPSAPALAAYGRALTAAKLSLKTALVVLVNSEEDLGASDRGTRTVVLASSPDAPRALAHELGHVLAHLADEYDHGTCDLASAGLAPNTTKDAASPPWRAILAQPPVEGAEQCGRGVYRPQATCLMRDLDQDLCPVCRKQLDAFFAARAAAQSASCRVAEPCRIPPDARLCLGDQDCADGAICVDGGGRFVCAPRAAGCRDFP
jgi:hypothetical protein